MIQTLYGVPTLLNNNGKIRLSGDWMYFLPTQGGYVYPTVKSPTERVLIY